jgi:hypothetical protein
MVIRARKREDFPSFYVELMLVLTIDYVVNIDLVRILSVYRLRMDRDVPNQRDQNEQKKHDRKVAAHAEKTQRRIASLHRGPRRFRTLSFACACVMCRG